MITPDEVAARISSLLDGRPCIPVASGTWAIAGLLQALGETRPRRRLALPAFLCHNPLAAALSVDWIPVFCEVDSSTGVPTADAWRQVLATGVDAALLVHLFGCPQPPRELAHECRARGVFLIEDACQALGATVGGQPCGSFGDAAVLSFGHTKQIDAGGGGILASEDLDLLRRVAELAQKIHPDVLVDRRGRAAAYTRRFYEAKARLLEHGPKAMAGLAEAYVSLVPAFWEGNAASIIEGLSKLNARTDLRRRKAALYRHLLSDAGIVEVGADESSAPWRFCFRLPGIDRMTQEAIVGRIRASGVHVSNWYLPLPWLLERVEPEGRVEDGAIVLSREIFQLWLDEATTDEHIRVAAMAFMKALP